MFTLEHFIWIGICAALILGLSYISAKFKFSFKTASLVMAAASLVCELCKIFTHMQEGKEGGMVIEVTALPLHLCSILVFVYFYLPFAKSEKLKGFLVSFSVPIAFIGAPLAILMATSGTDFLEPYSYQCFVYHAVMLWFAIYLVKNKLAYMGIKAYIKNMVTLLCLAFIMIWVNGALQDFGTNFFYVVRPPMEGLPILNLDNGWLCYFLTVLAIGFIGVTAVHLPFIIKEKKQIEVNFEKEKVNI